jgi:hypothetical protein
MHSFVEKFPQYALLGGKGRKALYLYEQADPESVAWAQMGVSEREPVAFCEVQRRLREKAHRPTSTLPQERV